RPGALSTARPAVRAHPGPAPVVWRAEPQRAPGRAAVDYPGAAAVQGHGRHAVVVAESATIVPVQEKISDPLGRADAEVMRRARGRLHRPADQARAPGRPERTGPVEP